MMKVWNVSLVIITFTLTMIGTFMTRSGIVQSVHAFGQDTELAIIFLVFISAILIFSFAMVIYRLPLLRSRNELDSWMSREFAFLVNNWVLLSAALFVHVATLFPTLSERVTGQRITVGPPFYNKWMTPIGLTLLFLTGVGPLIAWRRATPANLREQFTNPIIAFCAVIVGLQAIPSLRGWSVWEIGATWFSTGHGIKISLPCTAMVFCFALCAFTVTTIVQEMYRGTRVRQSHTKLDFFTSLVGLIARGKRRYGGYIVHVAIVLMFVGFAGDGYKQEADATLERGKSVSVGKYTVRFDRLEQSSDAVKDMTSARMTVTKNGQPYTVVHPAKWAFHHHEDEPPTTEVEIIRTFAEDLYVVLNGYEGEPQQLANVKVVVNPLVDWIWLGAILLAIGTLIAFLPDRAYAIAAREGKGSSDKPHAGKGAAVLLALLCLTGVAQAQSTDHGMARANDPALARNDREKEVFKQIVCQCGTCGRQVLSDCTCSTASAMRRKIQELFDAGKSSEQVIEYELATYPGQSALVVPLDKGFNRLAWLVPYALALVGIAGLVTFARRLSKRSAAVRSEAKRAPASAPNAEDEALSDRLDDELDELD
jgi:cytochrome c-type biogenesis protein CcmF